MFYFPLSIFFLSSLLNLNLKRKLACLCKLKVLYQKEREKRVPPTYVRGICDFQFNFVFFFLCICSYVRLYLDVWNISFFFFLFLRHVCLILTIFISRGWKNDLCWKKIWIKMTGAREDCKLIWFLFLFLKSWREKTRV